MDRVLLLGSAPNSIIARQWNKENFDRTSRFIARYDNPAFDNTAPQLSLSLFEDMVKNVFSSPKQSLYKKVADDAGV